MFSGFHEIDFDVFEIPGLEARMEAIKESVRPKLEVLGKHFEEFLAPRVEEEVYAHVAKHARRTVNPPKDTWVAFSTNARGYKQHPHFQIGLWQTHLFVTFGYIYEAAGKADFGSHLVSDAEWIHAQVPSDFVWIPDHMSPESKPAKEVDVEGVRKFGERLRDVNRGELLVGARWDRDDVIKWDGPEFIRKAQVVMDHLVPIYRFATRRLT